MNAHANKIVSSWNQQYLNATMLTYLNYVAVFQGAVCLTTGVIGNPNLLYLSLGINWGVAYDLPNVTWVLQNAHGWTTKKSAQAQIKRRHRRELYGRLETMIDR